MKIIHLLRHDIDELHKVVSILSLSTASEMTYTVSAGALSSKVSLSLLLFSTVVFFTVVRCPTVDKVVYT